MSAATSAPARATRCHVHVVDVPCAAPSAYVVRFENCTFVLCDGRLWCHGHAACIEHAAMLRASKYKTLGSHWRIEQDIDVESITNLAGAW